MVNSIRFRNGERVRCSPVFVLHFLLSSLSPPIKCLSSVHIPAVFYLTDVFSLREHHVFSTWPVDVVKQVAEESILQDYNSDEVIIRDSFKMHCIVFVTKVRT